MSFESDIEKFRLSVLGKSKIVIRKIAFELFNDVVNMTPVDTGRARGNWFPEIGSASREVTENFDKNGGGSFSRIAAITPFWTGDRPLFLSNNVPYIIPLEYGHSKQSPAGMARIAIERARGKYVGK